MPMAGLLIRSVDPVGYEVWIPSLSLGCAADKELARLVGSEVWNLVRSEVWIPSVMTLGCPTDGWPV